MNNSVNTSTHVTCWAYGGKIGSPSHFMILSLIFPPL